MSDRRFSVLLIALVLLAAPAAVFRFTCVGRACDATSGGAAEPAPFCGLPKPIRGLVQAGFREGRSPDVLGILGGAGGVDGGTETWSQTVDVTWPGLASDPSVPIAFAGAGIAAGASVEAGTTLSQIAPTLASAIGFDRPFPRVRSGVAIPGVVDGGRPRLIVEVALKGIGGAEVADPSAWPNLHRLMADGAGTMEASTGSLPLDPTASLTTIGTGGPPSEHGITGTVLRNTQGVVARAWEAGAPGSIIATLPEDLDEATDQRAMVGLVATERADAGIVGGTWYPRHDRDATASVRQPRNAVPAVRRMLAAGFGRDRTPDVLAVVIQGSAAELDDALGELWDATSEATRDAVIVVAGTG